MKKYLLAMAFVHTTCLAAENSQTEAYTPEKILPAGVDMSQSTNPYTKESGPARKGTVAATLNNIALLNGLLLKPQSDATQKEITNITNAIVTLIPSLNVIGVFDLFTPEEWLATDNQPGRVLAAVLYLQKYPKKITPRIKQRLVKIQRQTKSKALGEAIANALPK